MIEVFTITLFLGLFFYYVVDEPKIARKGSDKPFTNYHSMKGLQ